jgi:hypothetical protein
MGIFIGSSKEFADTIACPKKARRFFSQRTLKVHEETFILPYLFLCGSSLTEASRVGGLRLRGKIFVSTVFTFTSLNIKVLSLSLKVFVAGNEHVADRDFPGSDIGKHL